MLVTQPNSKEEPEYSNEYLISQCEGAQKQDQT